jgi:hypothetical protein
LYTGWKILEAVILFVVQLWGLLVFAIILYVIYKKFLPGLLKKKSEVKG